MSNPEGKNNNNDRIFSNNVSWTRPAPSVQCRMVLTSPPQLHACALRSTLMQENLGAAAHGYRGTDTFSAFFANLSPQTCRETRWATALSASGSARPPPTHTHTHTHTHGSGQNRIKMSALVAVPRRGLRTRGSHVTLRLTWELRAKAQRGRVPPPPRSWSAHPGG